MGFLGLGVGKLDVQLDSYDIDGGDWLGGIIHCQLKEPVDAKKLVVRLKATQRQRERRRDAQGNERMVTTTATVYETELEVASEGTYEPGESFEFELRVPQLDGGAHGFSGMAELARVIRGQAPLEWTLQAALVQPWKFDVKKSVSLRVF